MPPELVVSDPAPLMDATIKKLSGGSPLQERVYKHRLQDFVRAVDQVKATGGNWDEVLTTYNSSRHSFDQRMAGRPPGGDWWDHVADTLKYTNTVTEVLQYVPQTAVLAQAAKSLSTIGQNVMGLTWFTDYVNGERSDFSRAFQGSLLQETEIPDATLQRFAKGGQADADFWRTFQKAEPELASRLNVSSLTPAGVVEANPDVFNVYIRQSVAARPHAARRYRSAQAEPRC